MEAGTGLAQGHPEMEQLCPFSIPCTWMRIKYCREVGDRWEDMLSEPHQRRLTEPLPGPG